MVDDMQMWRVLNFFSFCISFPFRALIIKNVCSFRDFTIKHRWAFRKSIYRRESAIYPAEKKGY